ncbi:uroporphyrinogen decarboxylase family protein [Clostridium formicaceticum]|uniref:Methylcobalamin:coenzyme M methyltransferase n=2 Tax=Clostridium formicaceticum TaxID=1497 RepID=A0AAC9RKT5_9CLOT|nr:uroporphyrinogen decarboxylase family protein [Clostridium formicaceticum]AOY74566.1 hypothetical protein BJL90_00500 [Clostridium formicaceticum]ARE88924.1 methylcobalamin:coenzyme M methyltransferase [Clostridium formicaceticum]
MGDMKKVYDDRVKRILTTVNHEEPDRVPILSTYGTWAVSYANSSIKEIEENPEKEIEVFCKPHEDIYCDATYTCGIAFDAKSAEIIGSKSHFISRDGETIQHQEITPMESEDYPDLIKNPMEFIFNKLVPRKAANLRESASENYDTLKQLLNHWKVKGDVQQRLRATLKEKYGIPVITGGFAYPPMDIIFDYLRGFKGISLDIRRRPEELLEAINALAEFSNDVMGIHPGTKQVASFPFYATMMHLPTFINAKQFEKFFWPTYEKMFLKIHELGGKLIIFLEGKWEDKYYLLNSMPKNFAIGIIEGDDVFEAKKKIGDNITIAGGMPLELLKMGTKDKCIDYAKKLLDECAPGGGYIFATSRELLSRGDLNVENLKAVNQFVHEHGVYK